MPLSIDGIAWSEKRDEIKQASINRWEIGFIPFFGQMSEHNRGIAKKRHLHVHASSNFITLLRNWRKFLSCMILKRNVRVMC
jgi:hypothetical protein